MEAEAKERAKKVVAAGVIILLGAAASRKKDVLEETRVKTIHYWDASRQIWVETIENGTMKASKLVAKTKGTLLDLLNLSAEEIEGEIEILDDVDVSEEELTELEDAFPPSSDNQTNPLQNG